MTVTETLSGEHFINGNTAAAEGAISAGCRFFAGYPITPSTEVAERMSRRLPLIGGTFIQMEDELASMCAILGAAWAGAKTMTATSLLRSGRSLLNRIRTGKANNLPTRAGRASRNGADRR